MQRTQDKFHVTDRHVSWKWTAAALAINAVILLTLVGLAAGYSGAAKWLSAAVQAEFTTAVDLIGVPDQIAQPVNKTQMVGSN
jgi:hypothetical protein